MVFFSSSLLAVKVRAKAPRSSSQCFSKNCLLTQHVKQDLHLEKNLPTNISFNKAT